MFFAMIAAIRRYFRLRRRCRYVRDLQELVRIRALAETIQKKYAADLSGFNLEREYGGDRPNDAYRLEKLEAHVEDATTQVEWIGRSIEHLERWIENIDNEMATERVQLPVPSQAVAF